MIDDAEQAVLNAIGTRDAAAQRNSAKQGEVAPNVEEHQAMEPLNKSFDKLRTNGNVLIPFMVSLSKHEYKRLVQTIPMQVSAMLKRFKILDESLLLGSGRGRV